MKREKEKKGPEKRRGFLISLELKKVKNQVGHFLKNQGRRICPEKENKSPIVKQSYGRTDQVIGKFHLLYTPSPNSPFPTNIPPPDLSNFSPIFPGRKALQQRLFRAKKMFSLRQYSTQYWPVLCCWQIKSKTLRTKIFPDLNCIRLHMYASNAAGDQYTFFLNFSHLRDLIDNFITH